MSTSRSTQRQLSGRTITVLKKNIPVEVIAQVVMAYTGAYYHTSILVGIQYEVVWAERCMKRPIYQAYIDNKQ